MHAWHDSIDFQRVPDQSIQPNELVCLSTYSYTWYFGIDIKYNCPQVGT